jgi:ADP-ribose pyrophosphatase
MNDRFEYDELVFDGIIAKVHKVGLRMRDGKVVQRDYIHYPGASIIVPVLDDGSFVLIRNWRFAVNENLLELPAGCLDEGEDPSVCAVRELVEETGYTAGRLEYLGSFYTGPGISDELIHAYAASQLQKGSQDLEVYEEIAVGVFAQDKIKAMIAEGKVRDAKTITALLLYWLKDKSGNASR